MVNEKMIKTTNLQRAFTTEEVRTIALNGVNIEINEGEFVAIMGPSGCGKSTLLNILGLLDAPTGGQYLLGGQDVTPLDLYSYCLVFHFFFRQNHIYNLDHNILFCLIKPF